jgi:MscS family membrane protein
MLKSAIFCLLLSFQILASEIYPKASLKGPRDTMNYFLKTMKGHKLGDPKALDLAIQALNLTQLDKDIRQDSAKLLAKTLINTFDRLEYIDITKVPESIKEDKWIYRQENVLLGERTHFVEISIGLDKENIKDKKWRFTPRTLKTISLYYQTLKKKKVVKGVVELVTWKDQIKRRMPNWMGNRSLVLLNGQWFGLFFLIFCAFALERIIRLFLTNFIVNKMSRAGIGFPEKLQKKLTFPSSILIFAAIWSVGVGLLEFKPELLSWFLRSGRVIFTIGIVIALYQLVDILALYLQKKASQSENKFDDILVPLIKKTAKTFVVAVGIIAIGDGLTLDMKGILAGMGIGGIAFALAAKDTIANLFGSLTVLLDRPFRIGDWVVIDGKIEGTVEEVGLRSCRIRTFYNSLITIPNGILTHAHIDNYGMRTFRRMNTKLGVQYDTPPEKIEAFCEGIRQLIAKHPHTRKDYFHVYLNGLGDSALEILLYVFWKVPDWSQELQEKHRLLLDIIRLGHDMGIEFAFPTQTLHMIQQTPTEYDGIPEIHQSYEYAEKMAENLKGHPFTVENARSQAPLSPGKF